MLRLCPKNLIQYASSSARAGAIRRLSTLSESSLSVEPAGTDLESESEAKAVEKIEDIIHGFIIRGSKPDWIPFLPGASYWVPPRRTLRGVADIVDNIANALTQEEYLSVTTPHGWPSSAFYIHNDAPSHQIKNEISITATSLQEDDMNTTRNRKNEISITATSLQEDDNKAHNKEEDDNKAGEE